MVTSESFFSDELGGGTENSMGGRGCGVRPSGARHGGARWTRKGSPRVAAVVGGTLGGGRRRRARRQCE